MSAALSYLAVIAIWATTPLAIKWSNDSVSPLAALGLRIAIALIIAVVVMMVWRRASFFDKRNVKSYWLASISLFPNMPLVYYAADIIPSGLIAVMFGLSPMLIGVMAHFMLGEGFFSPRKIVAQCLALVGLAIIFLDQLAINNGAVLGIVLMLVSTTLYSYSLVAVKRQGQVRAVNAFDQTTGAMLFAMPGIALCWYCLDGNTDLLISHTSGWAIVYLGVVGSLLGFLAFYYILSVYSVAMVSLIPMMTPMLALWVGAVFANELISFNTLLGSILIVVALGLYENVLKCRAKTLA